MSTRRYTPEFKKVAVRQVVDIVKKIDDIVVALQSPSDTLFLDAGT